MLYWIAPWLEAHAWGPFRLLGSHSVLLGTGAALGAFLVWLFLPRGWGILPTDRGKAAAADGGHASKGKPTGAGYLIAWILLPVILFFVPLTLWDFGVVACLYASMLFGYWDDKSTCPWGELRKGLLDAAVALFAAFCLCKGHSVTIWLPLTTHEFLIPVWAYVPCAAALLWLTTNATNCSDGVDELAGSLTLVSLAAMTAFLYVIVGHFGVAAYLKLPFAPLAPRWAILSAIAAGGLAGYLWYNAEPSNVLMGDAGSRMFGFLVGIMVLISGNPFLILMVSPVVLLNGGTGLVKLVLLRSFRCIGFDVRSKDKRVEKPGSKPVMPGLDLFHAVRFPLHDHCRRKLHWSSSQIVMRFVLMQSFLIPVFFILLVKIR